MSGLLKFSALIDWLNERIGWVCDYLVLIVCLISAGNATMRYTINYSTNAFLEIQWYLFGAIVLLGASYTLRRNEHVRVDVVYSMVSDRTRLWIDTLGIVLFLLPFTLFMIFLSTPFFLTSFRSGEVSMNAGGLILWPAKILIPLGFILLTLQAISELIKRIAALNGMLEIETKYEKPLQ
jgi:TRAP-type mannitol/chloroaromatic compound transport system permease small subunit